MALRGIPKSEDDVIEPIDLEYDYGVTMADIPASSQTETGFANWQSNHFGWNVVSNGFLSGMFMSFTDKNVVMIQKIESDFSSVAVYGEDGLFWGNFMTAYLVQSTGADFKLKPAVEPEMEVLLELIDEYDNLLDCEIGRAHV